jgi:L-ascorbate metabolism protein UlaG (beta-lactamase superfamily)
MLTSLSIILILGFSTFAFLRHPQFGQLPSGERMERIIKSPNYKNGEFKNESETPMFVKNKSYFAVFKDFLFAQNKPQNIIPSKKTDLLHLNPKNDILVWFGHASYFMQIDGKKILVDPVFSNSVSPVPFMTKAFKGTNIYTTDDIPEIDYLIITHDHWDHLDYETLLKLKPKIKKIVCGLGVGEHFEYWGFDKKILEEKDWNEIVTLDSGFTAYILPARHFSGRWVKRNQSLWISVLLQTPTSKIYISGDGGYDSHFATIGKEFGNIDFAILENGQYNESWQYIHMLPEQVIQAAKDLHVQRFIPVHNSKFALSIHRWGEPLQKIKALSETEKITIVTPMIGEQVNIKDSTQTFTEWWKN